MQMYPHWNARDNYRYGQKKKKRKRDKSDDPGNYSVRHFMLSNVVFCSGTAWAGASRPSITKWREKSGMSTWKSIRSGRPGRAQLPVNNLELEQELAYYFFDLGCVFITNIFRHSAYFLGHIGNFYISFKICRY